MGRSGRDPHVVGGITDFDIHFANGNRARAVHASADVVAGALLEVLALPSPQPRPLVVLNGGTSLTPEVAAALEPVLGNGLARLAASEGFTVLTGGTDAGVFSILGKGIAAAGGGATCLGVVPSALVTWPGRPGPAAEGAVPLEPNHTHFVLVEGDAWGAETATMFALAAELGASRPSVAVIANGGEVTRGEVLANLEQRREVVVLAGSGRYADRLAKAARGEGNAVDEATRAVIRGGRVTVIQLTNGPTVLTNLIRSRLGGTP
jgi:hypothetical protein